MPSAVHRQLDSGDERGGVGGEEGDRLGHLAGVAGPTQGMGRLAPLHELQHNTPNIVFVLCTSSAFSSRRICSGARPCLRHAAPPTAVGGAHNSPIANATTILESGLVHYRAHLYLFI